ncbi:hypothetical protein ACTJKO_14410 [Curtobacterium sp. 22159]|uniref:hypothetical protein n=1 Tax=Curtobacterium sp. 22159 TaxID=3453882 RepID=UPI003F86600E
MSTWVRYQSAVPNRHGRFPGVFALANGLHRSGLLRPADAELHREANRAASGAYPDPSTVQPGCYDRDRNPGARAWFAADAAHLLTLVEPYLGLLDRYGVPWTELRTSSPGRIVYRDPVQVIAVPLAFPDDWPFPSSREAVRSPAGP